MVTNTERHSGVYGKSRALMHKRSDVSKNVF